MPRNFQMTEEWCMRMAALEEGEVGAGIMHPEAHGVRCTYVFPLRDTCTCGVIPPDMEEDID